VSYASSASSERVSGRYGASAIVVKHIPFNLSRYSLLKCHDCSSSSLASLYRPCFLYVALNFSPANIVSGCLLHRLAWYSSLSDLLLER
jgi:hypothetical protein